jgi:putative transposase
MQMYRILSKRNNRIHDCFHKISKLLIAYCIANNIGTIFIGHNSGWKQNVTLGRITNQKFVQIPFNKLILQIQYKAELVGIQVRVITENYTSKCSALDNETIEHHNKYLGQRVHRGLFKSADGRHINADVNAAYNILKRGCETFRVPFNLSIEQMLWSPMPLLLEPRVKVSPIA